VETTQNGAELLAKGDSLFKARDHKAASEAYQQAVLQAEKERERSVQTEAAAQVARMFLLDNDKETAGQWLDHARKIASDADPEGWSRYLGVKGRFEWQDGDLATARQTFEQMYEYCNANVLREREIDAAHMVAIVADSTSDQIEWSRKGIAAAEAYAIGSWLGPLWNNLAGIYYDQAVYDSALACYLRARDYHWQYSGEVGKLFADYHVGMSYRLTGNLEEAAKWLRPVLAWAERIEEHSAIGQCCEDLGEIAIAKGRKADGIALLKRARSEYKAAGFEASWPEVWESINKRLNELGQ